MDDQNVLIEKLFRSECSKEELISLLGLMKDGTNPNQNAIMQKLWDELKNYQSLENEHSDNIYNSTLLKINKSRHSESN